METINIRVDGPGKFTPTGRLKAALTWAHRFVSGTEPRILKVELRRDTPEQVLVMQFDGALYGCQLGDLVRATGVNSVIVIPSSGTPYTWGMGLGGYSTMSDYPGKVYRVDEPEAPRHTLNYSEAA